MRLYGPVVAGILVFASSSLSLSISARAALGEKESSIEQDGALLSGTISGVQIQPTYSTRDIVSESIAVREYMDSAGVVFALSWRGRIHPDFSALLGNYYGEYLDINPSGEGPHIRGSRRSLRGSRLVVEKFGHMGMLRGRAFAPALLPTGLNPNEIK